MNRSLLFIILAALVIISGGVWYISTPHGIELQQRLAECQSFDNGSTQNVVETSRVFVNLPKDLYPDVNLTVVPHGATAGYVSNGGLRGSALGAQGKPDCSSTYYEFNLMPDNPNTSGSVDISSQSAVPGIPNYLIHFFVTSNTGTSTGTPPPPQGGGSGLLQGTVMLGPTCPVEHNPPDPGCADKPYQTLVAVFRVGDPVHVVVLTHSNAEGSFSAALSPGEYSVGAGERALPRCAPVAAAVTANATTTVSISCDTGIR